MNCHHSQQLFTVTSASPPPLPPTPLLLEEPPFLGRCWIVNSFRWTFLSNLEHSRAPRVPGVFAKEAPSLASSECPGRMDLQLFPAGNCSVMLLLLPVTLLPHLTSLLPSSCVLRSPPPQINANTFLSRGLPVGKPSNCAVKAGCLAISC